VGLVRHIRSYRPSGAQILISLLIAGLGWLSGQALSQVDQDMRIMYTEYTLGAADLAHISADVIRYRNTIIRALEADNKKDFERITESLPTQRAKIQHAVDRYAAAGLRVSRSGRSEPEDIEAVRRSLDQYFSVASRTVDLLTQEWNAPSQSDREALRRKAEEHAADNGGPKMIQVSLALDRLLDTVAEVAKDMRDEGTKTIQRTSVLIIGGSFFIAALNLLFTSPRKRDRAQDDTDLHPVIETRDAHVPLPLGNDRPNPVLRTE
jgi:hypothetical protein